MVKTDNIPALLSRIEGKDFEWGGREMYLHITI